MRLLLTRPRADSEALAVALRARGHACAIAPLLTVAFNDPAGLDGRGVQAVALTSANGARALARTEISRETKLFAVGDATARAAAEAGFADVVSAGGDVDDLAAAIRRTVRPQAGAILHITGSRTAGDLAGTLRESGFDVRRRQLYRAEPADRLPDGPRRALGAGQLDAVILFSPRTAATFARLVRDANLAAASRKLGAFCLSPAVAAELDGIVGRCRIAARPTQDALLALFDGE